MLIQVDYILNHDGDLRTSTWAAYELRKANVEKDREKMECFRRDVRLRISHSGYCSDYDEPTYDQGHLAPNSDMKRTLRTMINSYMMSNMAPQHCNFNRGSWLVLEGLVRHWAVQKNKIYVITGAVFDPDGQTGRDPDDQALRMVSNSGRERVAVPSHFYKILTAENSDGTIETLALLMPHNNAKLPDSFDQKQEFYEGAIVSIDTIEAMTGINFFPGLEADDPQRAAEIEAAEPNELWELPDSFPRRLDQQCP